MVIEANKGKEPTYHKPVMLDEVIAHLKIKIGGFYIDATFGDGGHTLEILKKGGKVLALDYDKNAIQRAQYRIATEGLDANLTTTCANFSKIDEIAQQKGFNTVDGILYDLGYSSYQLDQADKGLSFMQDTPLDMRLSEGLGVTAADLVNALSEKELTLLLSDYSDEKYAKKFARAIVEHRNLKKFQTSRQLADLLKSVAPSGYEHGRIHPATRTFQALRIVVNGELENLKESLPRAARLLNQGSRMIVISFHSKEDEIVKKFGQNAQPTNILTSLYKKPLIPTETEVRANVRARSARMRIFEKC